MTKNYIFDFGKVLVEFEPLYMTRQYIENEKDVQLVAEVLFDRLYWDKLDEGTITDEKVKEAVCARLPERLHESAGLVYENWYKHLPEIEGMRAIVMMLKEQGRGLYLLSNISETFAENYVHVPQLRELFSLFDGLVFSAPIHMVKPTKDIFEYLLHKYDLRAEDCTFIDDNEKNVNGAMQVGISAILFSGNAAELEKMIW